MGTALLRPDLTELRATAGRSVSINVPVRFPDAKLTPAVSTALSRGRQKLQRIVQGGRTDLDFFPDNSGTDVAVAGRLAAPWSSVFALRARAYDAIQEGGAEVGVEFDGFGPEDVAVLDLDADPVEKRVYGKGEGFFDAQGEINPDGTMNVRAVLEHGAVEGLENVGETFGGVLRGAVSSLSGGLFKGLGTGGTIVLLLVLALGALLVLAYVFGPSFLVGGVRAMGGA